ncbi:hypothetical protein Pint_18347 [Pistacia integerrima]|uniref:Uncharacterized protein n=1 Tax=Pistacia integerrima TaxID=434235 RepID=A0ACC0YX52_9ROSI|nr:hypothetical protein Pint_18347 [Pistacia integerrima]
MKKKKFAQISDEDDDDEEQSDPPLTLNLTITALARNAEDGTSMVHRRSDTANSNDHRQKPSSLLADWNSYASSQESDSSAFDLEAAVHTTIDKVSVTFIVCDEFERLSGFCSLAALLVLTYSMLFLQNGGGADEKLEDFGKSTSLIDLRVALGSGCVQWRRNHQLNSCLEDIFFYFNKKLYEIDLMFDRDKVYVAFHDESWGVPVYDDNQLFELLALCGMLMDYNWT